MRDTPCLSRQTAPRGHVQESPCGTQERETRRRPRGCNGGKMEIAVKCGLAEGTARRRSGRASVGDADMSGRQRRRCRDARIARATTGGLPARLRGGAHRPHDHHIRLYFPGFFGIARRASGCGGSRPGCASIPLLSALARGRRLMHSARFCAPGNSRARRKRIWTPPNSQTNEARADRFPLAPCRVSLRGKNACGPFRDSSWRTMTTSAAGELCTGPRTAR